jgi:hypothetical protein
MIVSQPRVSGLFTQLYMSTELGLDLENLFQPAWTQAKTESNRFERFTGNEGVKPERSFSSKPGERRAPRTGGGSGFGGGAGGGAGRGGPPRGGSKFGGGGAAKGNFRGGDRRDDRRDERREPAPALAPLPDVTVTFLADEKGVEQLARQIKVTGRAYPLFQIAQLVLQKPERYGVQIATKKKADGTVAQALFVCALDDSPWLSEDEAVAHVLKNHFATFYTAERVAIEAPKGVYTFVAQCGLSGVILGPPNHHDYQNQLRKLHTEKFARMPFDAFKARVKIVKDEAVVKKWIEEQSFKTEYNALNVAEPLKLASLEEVEKHFRATHQEGIIKSVETLTIAGVPSRSLRSAGLQRLVRQEWEAQKHFPLQLATKLSHQFASHGLQFFKVNKTVTHVSVARPQFLDLEATLVSDGIRRIVEFINAQPKTSRRKLIESLAPTPKVPKATVIAVAETPAQAPVAENVEGQAAAPAAEAKPAKPAEPKAPEPTVEQMAVISDLHWLVHQGHVLEFADGRLETAKKPAPKPVKAEKKSTEVKPAGEVAATAATETAPAAEAVIEATTETIAVPAEVEITATESIPAIEEAPVAAATETSAAS